MIIITSTGIMSLALGYFLNLINRDLVQEVIKKTRSLQKANRKLERMNVLKDDFINIASHELKSPLHPIYGFVELAKMETLEVKRPCRNIKAGSTTRRSSQQDLRCKQDRQWNIVSII